MLRRLYNKLFKNPTTVAETTETGTGRISSKCPLCFLDRAVLNKVTRFDFGFTTV